MMTFLKYLKIGHNEYIEGFKTNYLFDFYRKRINEKNTQIIKNFREIIKLKETKESLEEENESLKKEISSLKEKLNNFNTTSSVKTSSAKKQGNKKVVQLPPSRLFGIDNVRAIALTSLG
jgi:regulator of replication initiation timing